MKIVPRFTKTQYIREIQTCHFIIPNKSLGKLSVNTNTKDYSIANLFTEIKNKHNKIIGSETMCIDTFQNSMTGLYIEVNRMFQKSEYRFGELLRLVSIIEMMENNLSKFKLFSKSTAINFHLKYKFLPNITRFDHRDLFLKNLLEYNNPNFNDIIPKAKSIIERISKAQSPQEQRELAQETTTLSREFVKRMLQENDKNFPHPFTKGIDMELTREEILKNKDFFNQLFANHNIDYKI